MRQHLLELAHLCIGCEIEEQSGHQREEQTRHSRQGEGCPKGFPTPCSPLLTLRGYEFFQCQHRQERYTELRNDQYRLYRSELGIHRHIVDEEVGQRHVVLSPCQHDAQQGGNEQCPLQGSSDDEQSQDEEHQHESSHIDGTRRAWLLPVERRLIPVHRHLVVYIRIRYRSFSGVEIVAAALLLTSRRASQDAIGGTTLDIRDKQRPCLADAIAVVGDVVALQSTRRLVGAIGFHQFALAAHRLLRVLPRMIERRRIHADAYHSCSETYACCLQPMEQLPLADGIDEPSQRHQHDDEQVVVGHLHMVGIHLESSKDGCHDETPQIFATIGQDDTGYHRRQISQCPYLPDMSRSDDDEEVAAESPHNGTQSCHPATEVESTQQDVEAQEVDKDVPHIFGQPQMVGLCGGCDALCAAIRRSRLVGGHTSEGRVGPTGGLARRFLILLGFLPQAYSGR